MIAMIKKAIDPVHVIASKTIAPPFPFKRLRHNPAKKLRRMPPVVMPKQISDTRTNRADFFRGSLRTNIFRRKITPPKMITCVGGGGTPG